VDLAWRAVRQGATVVEVPIAFVERVHGRSKMSGSIVREALWRVTQWALALRWEQVSARVGAARRGR
jgi:dolichol-phosphate mannosyltransferase